MMHIIVPSWLGQLVIVMKSHFVLKVNTLVAMFADMDHCPPVHIGIYPRNK